MYSLFFFQVSYSAKESYISNAGLQTGTIYLNHTETNLTICSLFVATLYDLTIAASTSIGYGPAAAMTAWTEVGQPAPPDGPILKQRTPTTLVVAVKPVQLQTGPITCYLIIVEKLTPRQRRDLDLQSTYPDLDPEVKGYISARLEVGDLRKEMDIMIGDNKTYNGFQNIPLEPETEYNISFVVVSSLDGMTKFGIAGLEGAVSTLAALAVAAGPSWLLTVLLPILLVLLVALIVAVICAFCYVKRKSTAKERASAWTTSNLNLTKDSFESTFTKGYTGKWSEIYELDQPRYLTIKPQGYTPKDIPVSDFQGDARPTISFLQEFYRLPQGKQQSWEVALRSENHFKNRFSHILAYDHSRVILKKRNGISDYVNANFVHGFSKKRVYIAAQSPFNPITVEDIWKLVFQHDVAQIVMMTRLEEDETVKCVQYWPYSGRQVFGAIQVRFVSTDRFANFTVSTFDVFLQGSHIKKVTQYQFLDWPDHGVPDDPIPLLEFRRKIRSETDPHDGPLLVHCGTGISRTAVFIAIDCLLEQASVEHQVNVFKSVSRMRANRISMVRTLKQYTFIYEILFEALLTNHTLVDFDLRTTYRLLSQVNVLTKKSFFKEQFETLKAFTPDITMGMCKSAILTANVHKNRYRHILPPDDWRPYLSTPGGVGRNDYINAVFLDTYTQKNAFVLTQTPLPHTVTDFWKLVFDYNITAVVNMHDISFSEETCATYWPKEIGIMQLNPFFVNMLSVREHPDFTVREIELHNSLHRTEKRLVRIFQFNAWPMYANVPVSREAIMDLIDVVQEWHQESRMSASPILVHCIDGATYSGLFCVLSCLFEKVKLEKEANIFHTVKHMKRRRTQLIDTYVRIILLFYTIFI